MIGRRRFLGLALAAGLGLALGPRLAPQPVSLLTESSSITFTCAMPEGVMLLRENMRIVILEKLSLWERLKRRFGLEEADERVITAIDRETRTVTYGGSTWHQI